MEHAKSLPKYLVQRYQGWKATDYAENAAWYRRLATEGQRPRAMVISCCDSRVHVTSIFGADTGEGYGYSSEAQPMYSWGALAGFVGLQANGFYEPLQA